MEADAHRRPFGPGRALAAAAGLALLALFFFGDRLPLLNSFYDALRDRYPGAVFNFFFARIDTPYSFDFDFRLWAWALPAACALAWAAAPFVPRAVPAFIRKADPAWWGAGATLVICAVFARVLFGGAPHNWDECVYDFQARIFAAGHLTAPLPPTEHNAPIGVLILDNPNFFFAPLEAIRAGRWFSMYPPFFPAALAVGRWCGLTWLVSPLAAAGTVFLLARLATRLYGRAGGAVAAILAAGSPFLLVNGASFFSDPVFILFLAAFLFFCQRAMGQDGAKPADLVLAGLALGLAFGVREYATLAACGPFILYTMVKWRRRWVWLAAGAALPAAAYLAYNWAVAGSPFVTPRAFSTMHHFGFGEGFGAREAFSYTFQKLYVLSSYAFGWPFLCLVPIAAYLLAGRPWSTFEKILGAAIAATVLMHVPIANPGLVYGPRYWFPLFPALVVLTCGAITRFWVAWPDETKRAVTAGVALLVVCNAALYLPHEAAMAARHPSHKGPWLTAAELGQFKRAGIAPALVFLGPREKRLTSHPNDVGLRGGVVVARDQGPRNVELMKLFPGRRYFLVNYERFRDTGEMTEIPADAQPSFFPPPAPSPDWRRLRQDRAETWTPPPR